MNKISGIASTQIIDPSEWNPKIPESVKKETSLRQAFQGFVAGTFYKQMFQSLRKMHGKPAYFHGGSAEEMFQSQMDQQVAEDLAREQGSRFSDALFSVFAQKFQLRPANSQEKTETLNSPSSPPRAPEAEAGLTNVK